MIAIGNIKNHLRSPKLTQQKFRKKQVENINLKGVIINAYKTIRKINKMLCLN